MIDSPGLIGLDLDGVVVRPPLGMNFAISRRLDETPPQIPEESRASSSPAPPRMRRWLDPARYAFRRPMPGVREALAEMASLRRIHVVSARSKHSLPSVEGWLRKHELLPYIEDIHLRDSRMSPSHFKYFTLTRLGIREHIDDDGATAYCLAKHAGVTVYLCDWRRNRGLSFPPAVHRAPNLAGVVPLLARHPGTRTAEGPVAPGS